MKTYKINYSGNSSFLKRRIENSDTLINAESERQAVEEFYQSYFDQDYFPQDDGSIFDCDGNMIAEATDDVIWYDGGYISAEEVEE